MKIMFKSMPPPISYYGGKQKMACKIIALIPKHTVYCEPFCGGATILFKKPWPNVTNIHNYCEVINDNDLLLVNFFKQLRDNGEELCRRLELTPYSEHEYKIAKQLVCDDPIEMARRYYINITQSFSNKLDGGWGRSVYSRNLAATWMNKVGHLCEYISRMMSVHIICQDALTVIKQWDSPQTLFYCDPPYPKTVQGHYGGYTVQDFHRLVSALDACQGSFLLSNYEQSDVEIPASWVRHEFAAYCSANGKGQINADRSRKATKEELGNRTRIEVVWKRNNRVPVRAEIQKLYKSGAYDCFTGNKFLKKNESR